MNLKKLFTEKTMKRELAVIVFLVWCGLTYKVFLGMPHTEIASYEGVYGSASTWAWLYIAAAFGLDQLKKMK